MRRLFLFAAVLAAASWGAATAKAQNALLYGFEPTDTPALDGFFGVAGVTATQDTIGATQGVGSMKDVVAAGAGFSAARTTTDIPGDLNLPITAITLDVTNPTPYAGTFADVGVLMFLSNPGIGDYGEQFQTDTVANVVFTGTQTLTIPLTGVNFNGSGDNTWAQELATNPGYEVTGFQLFFSKDTGSGSALTTYVDNIQAVGVPEPATIGIGAISGLFLLARRRRTAR
jgi:hypothetical protein